MGSVDLSHNLSVHQARNQEQKQDGGNQAVVHEGFQGVLPGGFFQGAEYGVFREHEHRHQGHINQQCQGGPVQGFVFQRGDGLVVRFVDSSVSAQVLFHDFVGDKGAYNGQQHRGGGQEVPVAGGIQDHVNAGGDQGLVGDPSEQGIGGSDQQVGGEASGYPGEGGGHAGQGMASCHGEDHGSDGDYDHVSGIRGDVGHNPGEHHNGGEKFWVGIHQQFFQGGVEQAGPFGYPYPQHGHQNGAQRSESGVVFGGGVEHVPEPFRVQQRNGFFGDFRLGPGVKIGDGQALGCGKMGNDDDNQGENEEKDRRVGQFVADDFHPSQETSDFLGIFLLGCVGHGWCLLLSEIKRCRLGTVKKHNGLNTMTILTKSK